jgi:hypothetical protein
LDAVALPLPLEDRFDLDLDDIFGRQRMARDQQNANVAGGKLRLDVLLPVGAAGDVLVGPKLEGAVRGRH